MTYVALLRAVNARGSRQLESLLEAGAVADLDLQTKFFVRSAKEWEALVGHNPFSRDAETDPSKVVVVCLEHAPATRAVAALQSSIAGPELIRARGKQAYAVYPDGIGRSRLTLSAIEKALGARGTARNWNTVLRLRDAVRGD